jgi:hypothetical protein
LTIAVFERCRMITEITHKTKHLRSTTEIFSIWYFKVTDTLHLDFSSFTQSSYCPTFSYFYTRKWICTHGCEDIQQWISSFAF